jgi:hypothetical protein
LRGAVLRHLTWRDESAVEEEYVVERSPSGLAWTWTPIAALPAGSTRFDDREAPEGAVYRVRARRRDPRTGARITSRPSLPAP